MRKKFHLSTMAMVAASVAGLSLSSCSDDGGVRKCAGQLSVSA